ncbi:DUF2264 domain-containing protein [Terrimonas sp.]|uniref:DUF2264 domain-containing protein n=1 Tax=Terrimonas sp. TaxID=1914338 RepID=UPI00197FCCA5|nr:DUF2264 domain-containing protein [Terrimonas sp.]
MNALYRISQPVIHNLANGTLKANMPLEKGAGYYSKAEDISHLEAIGRTLAGLAPWLSLKDDNTSEGLLRQKCRIEVLKGLQNMMDSSCPDFIHFDIADRQPIVDGAFLALAFLRAPDVLWHPLNMQTKKRFIAAFKSLRDRSPGYNNWLLFAAINEAFLLKIGEKYDPARIMFAVKKINEWYIGDGWYSDGSTFSMDYYNAFVIHPFMVELMKVLKTNNLTSQAEYEICVKRMARYAQYQERLIAPDGTFPVIGRSASYRTGAFHALAQTVLMEKLPYNIKPGQVRCALSVMIANFFKGDQNFDRNGWLVLGFNGHQPAIAESYISTGSLYLSSLIFLPLGLPAHNAFWAEAPSPWTSQKIWNGQQVQPDYKVEH